MAALVSAGCNQVTPGETVLFPDRDLQQALCNDGVDVNADGIITYDEAAQVTSLDILAAGVNNLSGLEAFVHLDSLAIKMLPMDTLAPAILPALKYLEVTVSDCKVVDVSGNEMLAALRCETNQVEALLLPAGNTLETLRCGYNRLRSLDVSGNPGLTSLACNNNYLRELDLSQNPLLTRMISCGNQLAQLDISQNTLITLLGIDNMPTLGNVRVWALPFPPAGVEVLMDYSPNAQFVLEFE